MTVRRLRVLIDARMLLGRFSGVARVVTRLVDTLARYDDLRIVALCGDEAYEPWSHRTDIDIIVSDFSRRDRSPIRRMLWEGTRLRGWIRRAGPDLFHAAWNHGVPARCPVPAILTIHDLIPWQEPQACFSNHLQLACYRHAIRTSARRASSITTVSAFTRRTVLERLRVEESCVSVVPNGVDQPPLISGPTPQRVQAERPSRPYVLYVGGHEDRKNVETILAAMESYWARFDSSLELRLTGAPDALSQPAAEVYRRIPGAAPIRFLGSPNDEELACQYASAGALLMLSRAEGFGLPVLEAMAHGCPVIAARAGALPEVIAEAGILVDPSDADAAAGAIRQVLTSSDLAQRLAQRGRDRASFFSWKITADAYRNLYRAAASGRPVALGPRTQEKRRRLFIGGARY
ncbi:MAG: glycosyltransferase family 1 protein [Phycisphaerales bacterium]|nr:glycosyltransferase family 1 protein [Phycisphaerales bacterium]